MIRLLKWGLSTLLALGLVGSFYSKEPIALMVIAAISARLLVAVYQLEVLIKKMRQEMQDLERGGTFSSGYMHQCMRSLGL